MEAPSIPANERQRMATLRALEVLDTPADERLDRLTRLAQQVFDAPIALVTLVDRDRQWFKSKQGLDVEQTPRDVSFCGHAILDGEVFLVPNATADERFVDNPLVTGDPQIRFYAGCPLRAADGHRIGTLCVIDRKPREFSAEQSEMLCELAALAERELSLLNTAMADETTGMLNRRGFNLLASKVFALCQRGVSAVVLHHFSLNTAAIHVLHGRDAAERALWEFGQHLTDVARDSDVLGRIDTHEFCALLTHATDDADALRDLRTRIDGRNADPMEPFQIEYTTSSVPYDPAQHDSLADLVSAADR